MKAIKDGIEYEGTPQEMKELFSETKVKSHISTEWYDLQLNKETNMIETEIKVKKSVKLKHKRNRIERIKIFEDAKINLERGNSLSKALGLSLGYKGVASGKDLKKFRNWLKKSQGKEIIQRNNKYPVFKQEYKIALGIKMKKIHEIAKVLRALDKTLSFKESMKKAYIAYK